MRARKIRIRDYRGIEDAEIPIGRGGVIAKGRCESGKTSFLDAFRAALVATGVQPSDIRTGADKAEIVVEVETLRSALRIRRGITRSGTSLVVSSEDGFKLDAPQTRLREMLGGGGFDPVDFFLAKDAERRRIILDATPVKVTAEDLGRWLGDEPVPLVSLDGHGLEVLSRVRKHFYDRRTDANRKEKATGEEARRAQAAADRLAAHRNDDLDSKAIEDEAERARAAVLDVESRQKASAKARAASGDARARIDAIRKKAADHAEAARNRPSDDTVRAAEEQARERADRVVQLRADLATAEEAAKRAATRRDDLRDEVEAAKSHQRESEVAAQRADELEAAIAGAAPDVPEEEAIATTAAYRAAQAMVQTLDRAREEREAREASARADGVANAASVDASVLDRIVEALTNDAPRELAARGNAIPGFDVETMSLDGVPLDSLSGGQKLEFAVNLAKRANPEARILICDGLERLDPERMDRFVELATEGGWQLIASRVEAGEITFEAIEP